jgi:hypothetical protein
VTPNLVINEASFVVRVSSSGGAGSGGGSSGGGGAALDYERLRTVNLTLVAEEVAEDRRRTSIPLTIHIREVKLQCDNTSSIILYLLGYCTWRHFLIFSSAI